MNDMPDTPSRRFGPPYGALASQLRAERERQGLTQRALARRIEDYSTSLCNWEKGRSVPGVAPLAKWAAGLGLELALVPVGAGADVAELRAELAAANERAEKAERLLGVVKALSERHKWQRDEARARLAEIGKAETQRRILTADGTSHPATEFDLENRALWVPSVRLEEREVYPMPWRAVYPTCRSCGTAERVLGDPPLCSNCAVYGAGLAKGANATGTALSATETSELQFDASVPATKPGGAQRGAQGLCESERNDETGTE